MLPDLLQGRVNRVAPAGRDERKVLATRSGPGSMFLVQPRSGGTQSEVIADCDT